ncbi:MAG: hypothetical protein VX492_04845, partial [Candidatus Thermoplasmatota archaeon]|nr:hypothetical protein [Candidatus Thermoplasmatota archaeon]
IRYSPESPGLEWYDEGDAHRRELSPEKGEELPVLARVAGRSIHWFELIGYLSNGEGVNLLITDEEGSPMGLEKS